MTTLNTSKRTLPSHDAARAYAKRVCGFANSDVISTEDCTDDDGAFAYVSVLFRIRSWENNSMCETSMAVWFETDGSIYGEW